MIEKENNNVETQETDVSYFYRNRSALEIQLAVLRTMEIQLAVLKSRFSVIEKNLDILQKSQENLLDKVGEINSMASRWKGGIVVIFALGGLIGWVATLIDNVARIFLKG